MLKINHLVFHLITSSYYNILSMIHDDPHLNKILLLIFYKVAPIKINY
jgi:hypothetical protein